MYQQSYLLFSASSVRPKVVGENTNNGDEKHQQY